MPKQAKSASAVALSKPFARSNVARRQTKYPSPHATFGGYSPGQLEQVYSWLTGLDVVPQRVVIFELGGAFYPGDVPLWAAKSGLPAPVVNTHILPGADNSPSAADDEVELDWQEAAAAYSMATSLPCPIDLIWGPNSGAAFAQCQDYATGTFTDIGAGSWSWGNGEDNWSASDMQLTDSSAARAYYPIFAASGDNDANDGEGGLTTDCPACLASIIGCGGTTLPLGGAETVWNNGNGEGTGGGFSKVVPRPTWQDRNSQSPVGFDGRMVPDLASCADPNTGVLIVTNGKWGVIGGTSAVSPRMAGLFAAINGARLKAGLARLNGPALLQLLWANPKSFFDVVSGNNGGYNATSGPDPCTGLGRPLGALEAVLTGTGTTPPPPPPPLPGGTTGTLAVTMALPSGTYSVNSGVGSAASLSVPNGLVVGSYPVGSTSPTPPPAGCITIAEIDTAFALLEARNPRLRPLLVAINRALDSILTSGRRENVSLPPVLGNLTLQEIIQIIEGLVGIFKN